MKALLIKTGFLAFCGIVLLCGCNSYKVVPLPYDEELKDIAVVDNPRVIVHDFVDVMADEFAARNIKLRHVAAEQAEKSNGYVIRYDARQSWDFTTYLSDATIRISRNGMPVASGKYHHVGESLSLDIFTKWRETEWKMKDVYDELLKNFPSK